MNVLDMIHTLEKQGFVVQVAKEMVLSHPDIANTEVVINTRLRSMAGRAYKFHDGGMMIELAQKLWFAPGNTCWEQIHETFLHELAHLFTIDVTSHGYVWKNLCIKFGIKPNVYHRHVGFTKVRRDIKIVGECSGCGYVYHARKSLSQNRTYSCRHCNSQVKIVR